MRIIVLRHAQTALNAEGRFRGQSDPPLDQTGLRQAEAVAARLSSHLPITRILTSPLRRATQTADAVAAATSLDLVVEPRLTDLDFGRWNGLTAEEAQADDAGLLSRWFTDPADALLPSGDSIHRARARVDGLLNELLAGDADATVVLVTHDAICRVLACVTMQIPFARYHDLVFLPASLSEFDRPNGTWRLIGLNDIGHLEPRDGRGVTRIRESSAGGIVLQDGKLLTLRTRSGEWVMPKGKIEAGEDAATAALREVREETGLEPELLGPAGITTFRYVSERGNQIDKTVRWFVMRIDRQSAPRIEQTFTDARFVLPGDALELLSFENDRELIRDALFSGRPTDEDNVESLTR